MTRSSLLAMPTFYVSVVLTLCASALGRRMV